MPINAISLPPLPYTPMPVPRPTVLPPFAPAQGIPQFVPGGPNWAAGGGVQAGTYVPPVPVRAGTFPSAMLPPSQAAPSISSQTLANTQRYNPLLDWETTRVPSQASQVGAAPSAAFEANYMQSRGIAPPQSGGLTLSELEARLAASPPSGVSSPVPSGPAPLPPPPIAESPSIWSKQIGTGKFGSMVAGVGTGYGANLALGQGQNLLASALGKDPNIDYNSSPVGRILGATRRGIGTGAWTGPVGGIVGGLGAGLGQSAMEAGHAVAGTGVGEALMEPGRQGAENRQSDNLWDKARGWGDLFAMGQLPAQAISGFVRDMGSKDPTESQNNVGEFSPFGDPQAAAKAQAAAKDQRVAEAENLRRQKIAAATPENLDAALGRLNVSAQTRQQVIDEFNSQSAVIDEMYTAGGLTVPEPVTERDGKLYVGDVEIPADQVDTVKQGDKDVKVAYRQATEADVDDMRAQTYQQILQSLPEVVQADRQQTEQMNRMLGYSAALQSVMAPYAQQANALADTYAAQAGQNPMIAPLADAFRVGQQGIANAYQGQAAALPFQIMLEQQAQAAQQQAEQQAVLERQLAVERYKAENGNRAYPGQQGADALSGLNLGG